ncbi:MAG: molybdopterin-binding protein [Gammaproteobacteria bacterium]|nr:molybdopterin-binding protein [Gammaproteobacteria bacterium]MBU0769927.1 molybdopterin-binding protein [Gammaproteobacteria bacterium]MBU0856268.1 molybdopterin-binding protein [Gammaproteobacteria bacterium]MBU1847779.1 molybdopterin-binding protein [Gammaproteobacteria bacterium]
MPPARERPHAPDTRTASPGEGHDHVRLDGWVRKPLRIDDALLAGFGLQAIPDFVVVCTFNGAHGGPRPMRGVPLRSLIDAAEPDFGKRTDFKRVALVAESREGYRALFSWNELYNTIIGDGVFVVADCADAPLPECTGPFALVSAHDLATGPRFVQRLASLALRKLW